jgi:hypothetical protein
MVGLFLHFSQNWDTQEVMAFVASARLMFFLRPLTGWRWCVGLRFWVLVVVAAMV